MIMKIRIRWEDEEFWNMDIPLNSLIAVRDNSDQYAVGNQYQSLADRIVYQ